jgi:hypothetical protein
MCKVLGLGFFFYKVMIYFLIFFGLDQELETNEASGPPTPHYAPNLVRKDKK